MLSSRFCWRDSLRQYHLTTKTNNNPSQFSPPNSTNLEFAARPDPTMLSFLTTSQSLQLWRKMVYERHDSTKRCYRRCFNGKGTPTTILGSIYQEVRLEQHHCRRIEIPCWQPMHHVPPCVSLDGDTTIVRNYGWRNSHRWLQIQLTFLQPNSPYRPFHSGPTTTSERE